MPTKNISSFGEVLKYLDSISNINSGGCAISALAMYRWLDKNNLLKKTTKLVYLYHGMSTFRYKQNLDYLKNKCEEPNSCAHCVIFHDNIYSDSSGQHSINDYKFVTKIADIDFIVDSINTIENWNNEFNRKYWLPRIEKKLGIKLSDISVN